MKKTILIFLCLFLPILSFSQTATKIFVAEKERYLADLTSINGQLYLSYGKVERPHRSCISSRYLPEKELFEQPYRYDFQTNTLKAINVSPISNNIFNRFDIQELDNDRIVIFPSFKNPAKSRRSDDLYLANNDLSDIQQVKHNNTKTKHTNHIFRPFKKVGNKFFFHVYNGKEKVKILWETDGTMEGTKKAIASKKVEKKENKNNKIYYFIAEKDKTIGRQIYYSDGKDTIAIANQRKKDFEPQCLLFLGNKVYFTANSKKGARELWVIDKKKKKCRQITKFNNKEDSYTIRIFMDTGWFTWDNTFFFMAKTKDKGVQLFVTDGKKYHQVIDEIGVEAPKMFRFSYAEIENELYVTYGKGENGYANQIWKITK